ncbi:hypothetical protein RN001_004444 [Aquatica leii]|uniref:Uncharacterized protein n=1 Tax=Aquatica leii TaxID=1421715 RepID=A0AAN7P5C9_9COLE|nr:hypothetical protein RN001_004444 [Aquatica leii]
MNFEAINKLFSNQVTAILTADEFKATQRYLIITRYILDFFIDKSIDIEHRVYYLWYATFFLRLWREWIKHHDNFTLGKNWISLNSYICIEVNAHALFSLIKKCKNLENPEIFFQWLYSSQPCERFFRQTRSMTSTYVTQVNFDMLELLQKQHRIQAINDIVSDSEHFIFPREKTAKLGINAIMTSNGIPSIQQLKQTIEKARDQALIDSEDLYLTEISKKCSYQSKKDISQIHEDDLEDVREEMNIFSEVEGLNIKDFKTVINKKNSDNNFLRINVNNKEMVVKKSTLIWFFSSKMRRLSSDRRCPEEVILINVEQYYAVMYQSWYIGRVIEIINDSACKIKFLKSELDQFV